MRAASLLELARAPERVLVNLPSSDHQAIRELVLLDEEAERLERESRFLAYAIDPPDLRRMERRRQEIARQKQDTQARYAPYLAAYNLGYEPYTPPAGWFGGYYSHPGSAAFRTQEVGGSSRPLDRIFVGTPPGWVLAKLSEARRTKLFDQFLVFAPDDDLFVRVEIRTPPPPPRSLYRDPILVGYVRTVGGVQFRQTPVNGKLVIRPVNGAGFLIAFWDLAKNRQSAGMNF